MLSLKLPLVVVICLHQARVSLSCTLLSYLDEDLATDAKNRMSLREENSREAERRQGRPSASGDRNHGVQVNGRQEGRIRAVRNAPREYTFQFLHYPSIRIGDNKKLATLNPSEALRRNLVYFNRPLDFGNKLILRIESSSRSSTTDWGFTLGFTTCDSNKVFSHSCHFGQYCDLNTPCGGQCLVVKIKSVDIRGTCVVIERSSLYLAKVTIYRVNGSTDFSIEDDGSHSSTGLSVFQGFRDVHPFLDFNGTVTGIRIVAEVTPVTPQETRPVRALYDIPGQPIDVSPGSWRFNPDFISVEGEGIERRVTTGNPTFIFNRTPFQVNNTVTFIVSEVDDDEIIDGNGNENEGGAGLPSLTFGVTTLQPDNIIIDALPSDANELLSRRYHGNWFVFPDLIPAPVSSGRLLSLKRNLNGITLKSGPRNIRNIIPMDSTKIVYPFFLLSGKVRKINVISETQSSLASLSSLLNTLPEDISSNDQSERSVSESLADSRTCVICLTGELSHAVLPCLHVVYCESCAETVQGNGSEMSCPICRGRVDSIRQLYFA